ncbi:hypothetical protein BsWGS_13890 [Bradybaena similaris]
MADNVEPEPPPPPPDDVVVTQPVTPIPPGAPVPRQGCMEKRTTLEKILLILVIIVLIICLGFIAAFLVFYFFASPPEGTCLTEQCVKSASRLKSYMDDSVDPCNNFYEYACGGWFKSQVLDSHEVKIDVESTISDSNRIKIRSILEAPIAAKDPEYKKQPKVFYRACMNTGKIEERGTEPFLKVLESVGKFPSLDASWNETDFSLDNTLVKLTRLAVMPLFTIDVGRDIKVATQTKIYVSDAQLALGAAHAYKNGRNDTRVKCYEKWLVDILVALGVNKSEAEQDIKEVVDFEIAVAKLIRSDVDKGELASRYNLMTVAMLQSKYPWLKWQEFFQGVVADPASGVYISIEEQIVNLEIDFLEKLGTLLANTPKRVLANYLMSHLLRFTSSLGAKFVALSDRFIKETQATDPKPRYALCVTEATSVYPESVSRMYVDNYFSKDAKTYIDVLIKDLRTSFSELLDENKWMSEETKKEAHAKLKEMRSKVGYPEYILDDERLNKLYTTIPAKEDEYFETAIAFRRYKVVTQSRSLREPIDRDKWPVHAAVVNAHYNPLTNDIIFPAAFLQAPVYSPEYSSSMNYGAIGMIIGHEITHGFDTSGSTYNAKGEHSNWWTEKDRENFISRTECFVNQYGCYKWDGHNLDGQRTLGENIADNGGIKQSFRAYRNLIKRQGSEEPRLPGLKLTHNQVFFLSFAQVWCAKYRDEFKKEVVESDAHTASPYRVFGALQNSQDFADTFKCEAESRMNPSRKCVLW